MSKSKKKARFAKGQVVFCELCGEQGKGYQKITSILVEGRGKFTFPMYGLDGEDPAAQGQGHGEDELRPLTAREQGPRRRGK